MEKEEGGDSIKPYITATVLMVFAALSLIYIKDCGFDEYKQILLTEALKYLFLGVGLGLAMDVVREARS